MAQSIAAFDKQGIVDKLEVYKRGEDGLLPEKIHSGSGTAEALKREQNREPSLEKLEARNQIWNREGGIKDQIITRNPQLSEPEDQRAIELAKEALEKCEKAKCKGASGSQWQTFSEQTKLKDNSSPEKSAKGK